MLIDRESSVLLIVDLQTSLAKVVDGAAACIRRTRLLVEAARRLDVPIIATEQYPERLGPTVDTVRTSLEEREIHPKLAFAAGSEAAIRDAVLAHGRPQLVIAGMEAHVCVLQTALGFAALGCQPMVVADAAGSRRPADRDLALARLAGAGVGVVSSEMVVFEWLERAGTAAFKAILPSLRDGPGE